MFGVDGAHNEPRSEWFWRLGSPILKTEPVLSTIKNHTSLIQRLCVSLSLPLPRGNNSLLQRPSFHPLSAILVAFKSLIIRAIIIVAALPCRVIALELCLF